MSGAQFARAAGVHRQTFAWWVQQWRMHAGEYARKLKGVFRDACNAMKNFKLQGRCKRQAKRLRERVAVGPVSHSIWL
jgi:hypothetical protein